MYPVRQRKNYILFAVQSDRYIFFNLGHKECIFMLVKGKQE